MIYSERDENQDYVHHFTPPLWFGWLGGRPLLISDAAAPRFATLLLMRN